MFDTNLEHNCFRTFQVQSCLRFHVVYFLQLLSFYFLLVSLVALTGEGKNMRRVQVQVQVQVKLQMQMRENVARDKKTENY